MNRFFEFFERDWFDPLIEVGSSYAAQIDGLILTVLIIVGIWFLAAEYIFLHFILKFRAKPGRRGEYIDGKNKRHKRWITIPHLCVLAFDVLIIVVSFRVWYNIKMDLPEDPDAVIRVVGQQWAWTFQHPGADGELDTPDDIFTVDELHVENEKTYHFELQATDVLHSFSVPVWRIKQDAIPGRTITGWFQPTRTGTYDVQCAEICGFGHGVMAAHVMVEDAETHAAWVAANTPAAQ
ncbi:MAG: cytochrome C oxidase subunit II [Gemmatimonadetes bacterium]|nr:cytochrome C oxidase subunit II [Gemmatimonadota bacterium]MXX73603.1 cytochrome C oxidase subunit II [Gemmatimonadota bacterium]MYC90276.1 cytochrome C oxidase subunit II [Gemmatimonadota bacterium]MYG36572.1 cytochrome C oxidase subunit II [Gemmatimonadota bacterium]MYJ17268.1 cytochrome C oxidase subunit II [Gemmatimonadota bacterium]